MDYEQSDGWGAGWAADQSGCPEQDNDEQAGYMPSEAGEPFVDQSYSPKSSVIEVPEEMKEEPVVGGQQGVVEIEEAVVVKKKKKKEGSTKIG